MNTCGLSATAANTFNRPREVMVDSKGKLYLADDLNHRILVWNSIPTTNNTNADLVIGQTSFTASTASTTASGFNNFSGLLVSTNRLFVAEATNSRILIFNSIPTSNGGTADLVLGHSTFTSSTLNEGGLSATSMNGPSAVYENDNKLLVADPGNNRVLIFPNTIITPQISLTTPPTSIGSGRYRLTGNVTMNNNGGTYSLQTLQADLNGTGYGNITFSGGRSDGGGNTIYDFVYDFDPSINGGDINTNLTLKFLASTYNADTNTLFYFLPFKLKSVTSKQIVFNVNKTQLSKIKDNISHFEVWTKPSSSTIWTKYIDNILPSQIDSNGDVYLTKTNSLTSVSYKVKAVDNWGNSEESNILSFSNTSVPVTNFVSFTGIPTPSSEPTSTEEPTPETSNIIQNVTNNISGLTNNFSFPSFSVLVAGLTRIGNIVKPVFPIVLLGLLPIVGVVTLLTNLSLLNTGGGIVSLISKILQPLGLLPKANAPGIGNDTQP